VQFAPPANGANTGSFGDVTAQMNSPRLVQFAGKFVF